MTDFILFGFLGLCVLISLIFLITRASWCQKLMLKKYFPQTVEVLKRYQANYEFWQMAINDIDKIDNKIKWHTERLEYYLVVNNQEVIEELKQLHLERKHLKEIEKNLEEMLKQDKFLIEAHTPFILFNDIRPYQIYRYQDFSAFDVMWVHRKQKKFEKIVKKHLTYLENYYIM